MPRRARIEFVSLRSSLVNLPISVYGPLVEHHVRPQNLAVHLLLVSNATGNVNKSEKKECYVGWTGMASSSSLARFKGGTNASEALETIEIDPQFANGLGLRLGDIVEIGLLHDLPIATSVTTEPLSPDDWEIIELHAEYVEQNLLSQVRAASVGQEVDVWVFGRTRARLRVVSFDPSSGNHAAVLLGTNTEVSIAPKKRLNGEDTKVTTVSGESEAEAEKPKLVDLIQVRALPSSFFAPLPDPRPESKPVALVSYWTYCRLAGASLPLPENEALGPVHVLRVKMPVDPLAGESAGPGAAAAGTQSAKVIHAPEAVQGAAPTTNDGTGAGEPSGEEVGATLEIVTLRWTKGIPHEHVVFLQYDRIKDWESCILVSTTSAKTSSVPDTIGPVRRVISEHKHYLAGIDEFLEKCSKAMRVLHISHNSFETPIQSVQGILITGRPGSGKTSIAKAVAKMTESSALLTHTIYVDFGKLADERVPRLKAYFKYLYDKAAWHKPSILVLDNIDKVLSAELEHADSFRARQLTELFLLHFTHKKADTRGVTLLATAQSEAALHPRVLRFHLFKSIFKLQPPSRDARRDILAQNVRQRMENAPQLALSEGTPVNFTTLATHTEGFLPTDLNDLVSRAVHEATIRSTKMRTSSKIELISVDFEKAQVDFVPISLREIKLQKSDVSWEDIGGLHDTRKTLRETLEWPTKYAAIFAKCPLRLRSGILLYGYPGCGKTLLASAVAKECGLNFISVKGPELLNKYIGASEKSVRDMFERASAAKPCVLFFDEFDSIAPKRGHDSTGVTDRVVNQMLTQMDGAEGLDGVYVLAATSRPDLIDSALLRPGRLDKSLICDLPNFEERKEILQVVSRKVTVSPTIEWDNLALETEGYSGADLQAVIYNAHLEVVHSTLADKQNSEGKGKGKGKATESLSSSDTDPQPKYVIFGGGEENAHRSKAEESAIQKRLQVILKNRAAQRSGSNGRAAEKAKVERQIHEITEEHIRRSLASTRPSVPEDERLRLQRIYRSFVSDRSGEMPVPPESGTVGSRASLM